MFRLRCGDIVLLMDSVLFLLNGCRDKLFHIRFIFTGCPLFLTSITLSFLFRFSVSCSSQVSLILFRSVLKVSSNMWIR